MTLKGLLTQLVLCKPALMLNTLLDNALKWFYEQGRNPQNGCRMCFADWARQALLRVGVRVRPIVVFAPRPDITRRMCAGAPAERCA